VHPNHATVAVSADAAAAAPAQALAHELGLRYCLPICTELPFALYYNAAVRPVRLELRAARSDAAPVYVDFTGGALGYRLRHGSLRREPLARAVGLKGTAMPTVLDATAGLGRDAFILAALGCRVELIERSPMIAALLRDGLQRAAQAAATREAANRLHLQVGDAVALMAALAEADRPDVVYLDPMYPHRSKSALVKKEMRMLRALVGEDLDAAPLLVAALRTARRRVVVKRPRLAPALGGPAPSHALTGSTTRFDIYVTSTRLQADGI